MFQHLYGILRHDMNTHVFLHAVKLFAVLSIPGSPESVLLYLIRICFYRCASSSVKLSARCNDEVRWPWTRDGTLSCEQAADRINTSRAGHRQDEHLLGCFQRRPHAEAEAEAGRYACATLPATPGRGLVSVAVAAHRQLGVRVSSPILFPPVSIRGGSYVPAPHLHPTSAENSPSS
jgi:hypothetical protein